MALMSEERRREMEEEMSRFEQEIALPASPEPPAPAQVAPDLKSENNQKPEVSSPGVRNIFPSVLCPPPPPPPPASPPPPSHLQPLPPPPPPPSALHPPPMLGAMRFIPPQLRQPPRPPVRHPFIPVRVPIGFQHHHPVPMPFAPMHPHPPHMQHIAVGPIGVGLPMPPGFCPPGPPMQPMPNMNPVSEPYVPPVMTAVPDEDPENVSADVQQSEQIPDSSEADFMHSSAPAVYAAPPMKSQSERMSENLHIRNGDVSVVTMASTIMPQTVDKPVTKSTEEASGGTVQAVTNSEESNVSKKKEKKKRIVRMAGGQAWEDNSLMEWDPDDFRIFCGDLGNDVTDEVLIRAFSKYTSFVKAKVIRDKRTNKTKGYGFVSFKDPQDFIKAMREMNGRYVGSRPIKLRKSTWKDRNIEIVRKKQKEKEKLGLL